MAGFHARMAAAERWEILLAEYLRSRGWQVERFGQGMLTEGARAMLRKSPADAHLRWLPDLLIERGNDTVFIDAKNSDATRTGNHAVELASSAAMDFVHNDTGLAVWYAFVHPRPCMPDDQGLDLYPGFVDHETFGVHAVARRWHGVGSGTPFRTAQCASVCRYPTRQQVA
jgi:hypothetical protein